MFINLCMEKHLVAIPSLHLSLLIWADVWLNGRLEKSAVPDFVWPKNNFNTIKSQYVRLCRA